MDSEWAEEVLVWWITTADKARATVYSPGMGTRVYEYVEATHKSLPALREREDQTRRVMARVLGSDDLPVILHPSSGAYWVADGLDKARYALGRLRTQEETRAKLGSASPQMSADALHPTVWGAASQLWADGHFDSAVQRAATFLNADVQDRVGRHDVSDASLMNEAFSSAPPAEGKPRLRWPGADDDLTVKSMRDGLRGYASGCFQAIRNPATHATEQSAKQVALEQLAALSLLARWVEQCELLSAE